MKYARPDGSIAGDHAWLVVNRFTVIEGQRKRRPDIVVFVTDGKTMIVCMGRRI